MSGAAGAGTPDPYGPEPYETFGIDARRRAPLIDFLLGGLRAAGCLVLRTSPPGVAPVRVSFVAPWGERMGVVAYAFTANARPTRNRPDDEHRFQVKYGAKDGRLHELWQDPFGLYTTLFLGINPDLGVFVGADPVLNSPTRFFISKEFKQRHVDEIRARGWHAWEREQRRESAPEPREVLVGGTADHLLRYVLFEREARGEDQGHRQLLAERFGAAALPTAADVLARLRSGAAAEPPAVPDLPVLTPTRARDLEREFALGADAVLELIADAPRLKMAVRGWVAERHLHDQVAALDGVASVEPIAGDGQPDLRVAVRGGRRPVLVECKNVLRTADRAGHPRLDFMRTRVSQGDACTRYYSPADFDVVAACLHAHTERWEFAARRTSDMAPHAACTGKLAHRLVVDAAWDRDVLAVLRAAAG
jgi:hypothetical protein